MDGTYSHKYLDYFRALIYKFQEAYLFMDKFMSADTDQSPLDPPESRTKQDRILLLSLDLDY
jgi:hypothetical protein